MLVIVILTSLLYSKFFCNVNPFTETKTSPIGSYVIVNDEKTSLVTGIVSTNNELWSSGLVDGKDKTGFSGSQSETK
jgi:hypothetical protein